MLHCCHICGKRTMQQHHNRSRRTATSAQPNSSLKQQAQPNSLLIGSQAALRQSVHTCLSPVNLSLQLPFDFHLSRAVRVLRAGGRGCVRTTDFTMSQSSADNDGSSPRRPQVKTYLSGNPDIARSLQKFSKNPEAMRGWLQTQAIGAASIHVEL